MQFEKLMSPIIESHWFQGGRSVFFFSVVSANAFYNCRCRCLRHVYVLIFLVSQEVSSKTGARSEIQKHQIQIDNENKMDVFVWKLPECCQTET